MQRRAGRYSGVQSKRRSLIYGICINYDSMPEAVRKEIEQLCVLVAAERAPALLEAATTTRRTIDIALDRDMDERELGRLLNEFIRAANKRIKTICESA